MSDLPPTQSPEELKAAFLRKMAHEMRTPLSSMLMLAELLADNAAGRLGEREIGYARKLQRAGSEISALLTAVLDLSRIETGAIDTVPVDTPIDELIDEVQQIAAEQALEIEIERGDGLPAKLAIDQLQLKRLIGLLFDHAGRAGGSANMRFAAGEGGLGITLSHGGTMIPEEQRASAFQPFQPGLRGTAALALPIARALAELLGGRLELKAEGERDMFELRLPSG